MHHSFDLQISYSSRITYCETLEPEFQLIVHQFFSHACSSNHFNCNERLRFLKLKKMCVCNPIMNSCSRRQNSKSDFKLSIICCYRLPSIFKNRCYINFDNSSFVFWNVGLKFSQLRRIYYTTEMLLLRGPITSYQIFSEDLVTGQRLLYSKLEVK